VIQGVMKTVFLSLGSNIDAHNHVSRALDILRQSFPSLEASPVYESEAVGFSGDNFLNLVVRIETDMELLPLVKQLKAIEDQLGSDRTGPKFSSRVIDIDVIFYGDACGEFSGIKLPRYEVYENAYVLLPMKDLAPDFIDPLTGKTMDALWIDAREKMQGQKLWLAKIGK